VQIAPKPIFQEYINQGLLLLKYAVADASVANNTSSVAISSNTLWGHQISHPCSI